MFVWGDHVARECFTTIRAMVFMFSYSLPHACALVARLEDKKSDEIEIAEQDRRISYRDCHMSAGGL